MAVSGIASPLAELESRKQNSNMSRAERSDKVQIAGQEREGFQEGFWGVGRRRAELQFLRGQSRQDRGQFHAEDGAAFLPVVAKNPAAVLLHDAEANAEPRPVPLPTGFVV